MSAGTLHPGVAELLASRRLGSLEASRHRFTVSREEALLRLREQVRASEQPPWAWTTWLVRAANALSEAAQASITVEEVPGDKTHELRLTSIDVVTPGIELDGLDLSDMLAGALEPDLGEPLGGGDPQLRLRRFRMLMGRAINAALAHGPISIELVAPAGGRKFERREQLVEGRDPYIERKVVGCPTHSRFIVRVVEPRPGLSTRLGRWLRRRGEVRDELLELWRSIRLADHEVEPDAGEQDGVSLGPELSREPIAFGRHALYGPLRAMEGAGVPTQLRTSVWLARDGVLLLDLGPALREQGLDPAALAGWIDCPQLRLTADERSVARDSNFEMLVAWLYDHAARADGEGKVRWPDSLESPPQAASGRPIPLEQLREDAERGRELVYVWRHQAAAVPVHAKARIAALWPSEELLLRERFPTLRLVPLRALGQQDIDPADLTSLAGGCYEPLALIKDQPFASEHAPAQGPGPSGSLQLSLDAYIHRARTATIGFVVILAYERRVAQFNERSFVIPGVTLVCRVKAEGGELDIAALRRDHQTLAKLADLCRRKTQEHLEALLAHVLRHANPWENPFVRTALDELGPGAIELRYQQTDDGVRLGWRDSLLLDVTVGRTREGEAKTLRDGLRALRERGFVIVGHPLKRHDQTRSADPLLQPWLLDDAARALLVRLLGGASVLSMPVVAEAHPLVVGDPVEDQRHLVRQRDTIRSWLDRAATDPLARQRLLGHLLVARGLGSDTFGLESVPLLERYDPRALSPTRLVSLAAVLAEDPRPGLIPAGAVHRGLSRPMLEVTPGVAALLAEVAELEPGAGGTIAPPVTREAAAGERSSSTPIRRRARGAPPLLAKSVVHPLVLGRIQVAADASSEGIGLWSGGLRVGELSFPEPLGRVSGRLILTPNGQRIGAKQVEEIVRGEARELLSDAMRQRTLLPPNGPARRRLDAFVEYVRAKIREKDSFRLADDFGLTTPEDPGRRVMMLRAMSLGVAPLRPLGNRREVLLQEVVRQSLAMSVHFDTAMLSWRPVKLGKRRRDGSMELEFGLRNAWIQRGLDEDKQLSPAEHRQAALLAGVLVVAAFFEQAREREDIDLGREHLVVALWRLLELGAH
jgi:hypothetical protein